MTTVIPLTSSDLRVEKSPAHGRQARVPPPAMSSRPPLAGQATPSAGVGVDVHVRAPADQVRLEPQRPHPRHDDCRHDP